LGSVSDPMETDRSMSVRERVPDNPRGIEHGSVDARSHEVRRAALVAREHDAAVAAAKPAAHDLLERHVAGAAVPGRKLRYATKHIAHQVAKKARKKSGQEIREYRCDFCGGFHIGHVPASKRKEAS